MSISQQVLKARNLQCFWQPSPLGLPPCFRASSAHPWIVSMASELQSTLHSTDSSMPRATPGCHFHDQRLSDSRQHCTNPCGFTRHKAAPAFHPVCRCYHSCESMICQEGKEDTMYIISFKLQCHKVDFVVPILWIRKVLRRASTGPC